MKLPLTLIAGLETALNAYLALDPAALRQLGELTGRVIAVDFKGLDTSLYLLPHAKGVQVLGHYEGEPDARLRGTPLALARLGTTSDAAGVLFSGDVEISGDSDVGQRFKQILDRMDIDWEEHLSRLIGDVAAHQSMRAGRATAQWGRRTAQSLAQDAAEYLQEERRVLPARAEIEGFVDGVDRLRSDVDRLEARVRRLQQIVLGKAHAG